MSRRVARLSALTLSVLVPLAAGCSGEPRPPEATTTASAEVAPVTVPEVVPPAEVTPPVTVSYEEAESAFRKCRYAEAADLFSGYTEGHSDNPWGHYMLGLSAWKVGDHARSLTAFDQALLLDPNHRKSLLNSARVLLETSRPREALDRIERALAIEPNSGEGLRLLGRARHELGQIPEAIDAYQRAIALDDKDAWAMNNLGLVYLQQGRSDAALPPLARAVELRSTAPTFQNNLGQALERSGHFTAARTAYEAALAADSGYVKAQAGLTRVTGREDSGTVDLAALSVAFQAQIAEWCDSTEASDTTESVGLMARDSVSE